MPSKEKSQSEVDVKETSSAPNGVFLTVNEGPEGLSLDVQTIGTVKITEVPTLLELGAIFARKQIGIK